MSSLILKSLSMPTTKPLKPVVKASYKISFVLPPPLPYPHPLELLRLQRLTRSETEEADCGHAIGTTEMLDTTTRDCHVSLGSLIRCNQIEEIKRIDKQPKRIMHIFMPVVACIRLSLVYVAIHHVSENPHLF